MSDDVFLTNGAPRYLEYAGTLLRKCVAIDARPGNLERWRRLEPLALDSRIIGQDGVPARS
jgi:hypothetical protein